MDLVENEARLRLVFGRDEVPGVTKRTMREYRRYLSKHLSRRCRVTGRDDFPWEEFYVFGPGDPEEYEELKKDRPSYADQYAIVKLVAEPSIGYDIMAVAERLIDGKRFELELSWLKAVDEKSSDYQLLEDFGSWQVNWQ